MKSLVATTLIASLAAAPAFAGVLFEPVPPEPVVAAPMAPLPPPLPIWTGGYAGAQIGWGRAEVENDIDISDDDVIGGFHAGYDFEVGGGFVVGGEVAYDRANMAPFGNGTTVEVDNVVRLTARAGYAFGNTLVYAKGGAAWIEGDVTVNGDSTSADDWGWVAGAGFEHRIAPRITAGVEGLYHRATSFDDFDLDVDVWSLQARISYRF